LLEIVLSCFDRLVRELRPDFTSSGTLCRGWLYLPEGVTRPPVIVLAHGISLTHSFQFWRRAEAYAAAGFAVNPDQVAGLAQALSPAAQEQVGLTAQLPYDGKDLARANYWPLPVGTRDPGRGASKDDR
jgi:hypothetical protein